MNDPKKSKYFSKHYVRDGCKFFIAAPLLTSHWEMASFPLSPGIWGRPVTALSNRIWQKWHWASSESHLQGDWNHSFVLLCHYVMSKPRSHMERLTCERTGAPSWHPSWATSHLPGLTFQPFEGTILNVNLPAPADSMWGTQKRSLLSLAHTVKW